MDKQQRPHSRNKTVVSGSSSVRKGSRVSTSGPLGSTNGRRPSSAPQSSGMHGTPQPRPEQRVGSTQRATSGQKAAGAVGALGLLALLPKKVRSFLLIAVLVIVAIFLFKACFGGIADTSGMTLEEPAPSSSTSTAAADYASLFTTEDTFTAAEVPEVLEEAEELDVTVDSTAREKYFTPLGGGKDVVNIMVYMCGTDLESKYSMATADLKEMASAKLSDNINLIVCTGGCTKWQNNIVSNNVNQIYQVANGKMARLVDDFGNKAMTDPANLTNFIKYVTDNYPANRNALIFWDHGGGSVTGYGYDEKNKTASSMTLNKISSALKNAGCKFDFIGFDACLMATLENALVCNEFADYLIASEETEPGTGWYYTNWLNQLSANTSIPTVNLAKTLIDDYVAVCTRSSAGAQVTLSAIDLAELDSTIPTAFNQFATSTCELLESDEYKTVSDARASVRQFSPKSKLNQIDLVDFADRMATGESKALAKALRSCIKYNGTTISKANGVSIYFPYETLNSMNSAVSVYDSVGMDSAYTKCIKSFASLESAGQISAYSTQSGMGSSMFDSLLSGYTSSGGSSASPASTLLGGYTSSSGASSGGNMLDAEALFSLLSAFSGRSMPAGMEWADAEQIAASADYITSHSIDPSHITVTKADGLKVLSLTEEEWALIQKAELNVFVDDGEGFIDLGLDNVLDWTDNGDLLLDFDGTWLSLDGHVVAYYLESDTENDDGSWTTVGIVPAKLNGQLVKLQVVFDDAHPDGFVTGAYPYYADETGTQAKGLIPLRSGDSIQPLCDYYTYDNEYSASYTLGDAFTVGASAPVVGNIALTDTDKFSAAWRLTDIYGNVYWTPAIEG